MPIPRHESAGRRRYVQPVDSSADVRVKASGPIRHLCPHVEEIDRGTVTIGWTCVGQTIELHSLADYLAGYSDCRLSHEGLVDRIAHDIRTAAPGTTDVVVTARFETAGLTVEVTCGDVPGNTVGASGS